MRPIGLILPLAAAALAITVPAAAQDDAAPQEEAAVLGLNHIGLTVSDLDASTAFFVDVLGFRRAGGDPDYPANFVFNGEIFVTLWKVADAGSATAFDRKNNVGLHHMAITMRDLTALHALHETLKTYPGVEIEFGPEFLGNGPTTHMMIRDPSGLRLEFVVPRGRMSAEEQALPNPRSRD
jgi:lactoylglutathione lyase